MCVRQARDTQGQTVLHVLFFLGHSPFLFPKPPSPQKAVSAVSGICFDLLVNQVHVLQVNTLFCVHCLEILLLLIIFPDYVNFIHPQIHSAESYNNWEQSDYTTLLLYFQGRNRAQASNFASLYAPWKNNVTLLSTSASSGTHSTHPHLRSIMFFIPKT